MKTTKIFATIAIAAISVSALAGCIQTPKVDEPRAILTSTPEPTETVEPVVGDINGDGKVSPYEDSLLSPTSYTLPDGTEIPLVEGEPVPEVVIAAVQTSVSVQGGTRSASDTAEEGSEKAYLALQAIEAEGKKLGTIIIPVFEGYDGMAGQWVWAVAGSALGTGNFVDKNEAIAAADAWVAPKNANSPGSYVVVVFSH